MSRSPCGWSVVYNISSGFDHGDGIYQGSQSTDLHVSRAEVYQVGWSTTRGHDHEESTRIDLPSLSEERLAGIEVLLPKLESILARGGVFSLTPYMEDEGGTSERITIKAGQETISILLEEGRHAPYPPSEVVEFYELITGRKAPPPWK